MLSSDARTSHGHRSLRAEISVHLLRAGGAHPVSRRLGHHGHAGGHLPGDQHSGGVGDLAVHRPEHAGDGAARHDLQPVLDQLQRHRHQEHGGADPQRHFGAEDLLPARRQSRPRHLADRLGDQFDSRADAGRHPAADRRAVQRLERSGAAAQPQLRPPERAAALRLRHLQPAPAACAGAGRDVSDAGRRQVPADHGRHRPAQAAGHGA